MNASANCFRLIEGSEGCELTAYPCPSGIPTIGYGHTSGVRLGMTCTPAQASAWLCEDVHYAENLVQEHVKVALTQCQFDALVSIIFNVGPGAKGVKDGIITLKSGVPSTLLRMLNLSIYAGAADEFPKWCHGAGNTLLEGLVTRRARERALFLGDANFMAAA
jgi:lysozyme